MAGVWQQAPETKSPPTLPPRARGFEWLQERQGCLSRETNIGPDLCSLAFIISTNIAESEHASNAICASAHRGHYMWVSGGLLFGVSNEHAIDAPGSVVLLLHPIEDEQRLQVESDKKDFLDWFAADDQQPAILHAAWSINRLIG